LAQLLAELGKRLAKLGKWLAEVEQLAQLVSKLWKCRPSASEAHYK
jgi:hypothetical protein